MADIALVAIQAGAVISTFAFVFSWGLRAPTGTLKYLGVRRGLMLRSFLSVDILVPLIAMAIVLLVRPPKATSVGLLLLASSPAAPLVFNKISKAGGKLEYAVGLQVMLASLAIVMTPLTLFFLSGVTEFQLGISPLAVAGRVGLSILAPIIAGIAVRWFFPRLAGQLARPVEVLSSLVSVLVYAVVLLFTYHLILMLDIRSYLALALMIVGALVSGHLMASKLPEEQTTLALESAARNVGLALFIASTFAPLENALPVLIPYIIMSVAIGFLYVRYRKTGRGARNPA